MQHVLEYNNAMKKFSVHAFSFGVSKSTRNCWQNSARMEEVSLHSFAGSMHSGEQARPADLSFSGPSVLPKMSALQRSGSVAEFSGRESDIDPEWQSQPKHVFVLSTAGIHLLYWTWLTHVCCKPRQYPYLGSVSPLALMALESLIGSSLRTVDSTLINDHKLMCNARRRT